MSDINEKIFQALESAGKPLSASDIAEEIDGRSACDIDRQRLNMIFQALMDLAGKGSLEFDPHDPQCFRLKK